MSEGPCTLLTDKAHVARRFQLLVDAKIAELAEGVGVPVSGLPEELRDLIEAGMRYKALREQRVRVIGSAGVRGELKPNGYAHLGIELWTMYGEIRPDMEERLNEENSESLAALTLYTEISALTNCSKLGFDDRVLHKDAMEH